MELMSLVNIARLADVPLTIISRMAALGDPYGFLLGGGDLGEEGTLGCARAVGIQSSDEGQLKMSRSSETSSAWPAQLPSARALKGRPQVRDWPFDQTWCGGKDLNLSGVLWKEARLLKRSVSV